jgi:hypothetical protein
LLNIQKHKKLSLKIFTQVSNSYGKKYFDLGGNFQECNYVYIGVGP